MRPAFCFLLGGGQFSAARASAGGASRPPLSAALLVRFVSIVSSFALLSSLFLSCSWFAVRGFVCVCVCVYTLDSTPSLWLSKEPFWARGEEGSSMLLLSCDCDLSLVGLFLSCWDPTSYCWEFLSRQALCRRLLPVLGRGKFSVSVSVDKIRPARGNSLLAFCCFVVLREKGRGGRGIFCGILAREFSVKVRCCSIYMCLLTGCWSFCVWEYTTVDFAFKLFDLVVDFQLSKIHFSLLFVIEFLCCLLCFLIGGEANRISWDFITVVVFATVS